MKRSGCKCAKCTDGIGECPECGGMTLISNRRHECAKAYDHNLVCNKTAVARRKTTVSKFDKKNQLPPSTFLKGI